MSRFGADPRAFFETVYKGEAPWEVGGPQPAMAALIEEFPPAGPVLDLGCASGDLAIFLAQRGLPVLGIDFVPSAIEQARQKAAALPHEVASLLEFQVADALRPSALQRQFGAVMDSGFFHLLTDEQCDQLVQELAAVLRPGGRYYLHEFAIEFAMPNTPRQVTQEEVRRRFTPEKGWRIHAVRSAEFFSRVAPPVAATLVCIERLPSA